MVLGLYPANVGDEALVDDPGYPGIRASLAGHGVTVRPVPVDAEGLVVDHAAMQWSAARLAVVTPTSQFPTGVRMSLKRRLALLRTAYSWTELRANHHESLQHIYCDIHFGVSGLWRWWRW